MRPTEDIEKRIKNVNIVIDSESNKRVFSNILQAFEESTAKDLAPADRPNIWRIILRNPITKLAAAVMIAGVAFLGGRLSVPRMLPGSVDVAPRAVAEPDGITVPSDVVAWLEAARLFRQLGMEDRMDRAVERAGRLLPVDTVIADGQMGQVFAAAGIIENQKKRMEPMGMSGPHPSAVNQILAQFFGD